MGLAPLLLLVLVGSAITLYVLVCADCGVGVPGAYIDIRCEPGTLPGEARCTIKGATADVEFSDVGAALHTTEGIIVGEWSAPVNLPRNGNLSVVNSRAPVSEVSQLRDDGDGRFGVNDYFLIEPVRGMQIRDLTIRLSGGGAHGSAAFP